MAAQVFCGSSKFSYITAAAAVVVAVALEDLREKGILD